MLEKFDEFVKKVSKYSCVFDEDVCGPVCMDYASKNLEYISRSIERPGSKDRDL